MQTPRGHRPLLLCLELWPWHLELSLAHHWNTINVRWENESGNPGHHQQPRIPSRETSPGPCPPATPAHLAPEWPLSQRGAGWWGQFGDGAPRGSTVGLEQMGCIFGKLQDVAGVCWLGVNGQDRACEGRGEGEREELESQCAGSHLSPSRPLSPPGPLPSPPNPHPGLKATPLRRGLPQAGAG